MTLRLLILGARAPACLEWARAAYQAGADVTVADSLRWPLARFSLAAHRYLRLPEPRVEPLRWAQALAAACTAQRIDLVIPTCEEAFYLAWAQAMLPCPAWVAPMPLMHSLHHKGAFAALTQTWAQAADASDAGDLCPDLCPDPRPLTTPSTTLLTSPQALLDQRDQASQRVFKPAYSRFAVQTRIRPSATELEQLARSPQAPTAARPWVAQAFVAGREHCSYSLFWHGELLAHSCYHPRYRVGSGSGIYFEPTDPPGVRAFVHALGRRTSYHGQLALDLIEDAQGRCHLLECNPRATSGVHLFDDQGPALIARLREALLAQTSSPAPSRVGAAVSDAPTPIAPPKAPLTPTPSDRMVGLAMLLIGAPRYGRRTAFWRGYRQARDVIVRQLQAQSPAGSRQKLRTDAGPVLSQGLALVEILARSLSRQINPLAASTSDIEWDGDDLGAAPTRPNAGPSR